MSAAEVRDAIPAAIAGAIISAFLMAIIYSGGWIFSSNNNNRADLRVVEESLATIKSQIADQAVQIERVREQVEAGNAETARLNERVFGRATVP